MSEKEQIKQANEDIKRAALAEQVLNNPIYQEAFIKFRAKCVDRFTKTKFEDHAEREEIWRKMQVIDYVENELKSLMETGDFARETLTFLEKARKTVGL